MTVRLKTTQEIDLLRAGGQILGRILDELSAVARPGVTGRELDTLARRLIADHNAQPSFLHYAPDGQHAFPAALCVSVNAAVVHGLPNDQPLVEGDIVGLDLGITYKGLYLDAARTVPVGAISTDGAKLLAVTYESLQRGIQAAQASHTTGDIGAAIQQYVEQNGFSVVRQLVGHGVGYGVHEEPKVPNFGSPGRGPKLQPGLVIAIEPMVTRGDPTVITAADTWTVKTASGQLAAHEEDTIAITEEGPVVLTR